MKRLYPADYSLQDWMWLNRKNLTPKEDTAAWMRAQVSAIGPNHYRN